MEWSAGQTSESTKRLARRAAIRESVVKLITVASGSVIGGATVTRRNKVCVAQTGLSTVDTEDVADAQRDLVAVVAKRVAWIRKNKWQVQAERSNFLQATVAAGFQWTFPVCEAIREPQWQLQGAGVMPAPYCFHERASGWMLSGVVVAVARSRTVRTYIDRSKVTTTGL